MIEFKDVTKEYSKGIAALNGVNLKIEKGEFAFIVGDSGSGKSTLIRLLLKELDPTSGSIIVNGQNLNRVCSPGDRDVTTYYQTESAGSAVARGTGTEI